LLGSRLPSSEGRPLPKWEVWFETPDGGVSARATVDATSHADAVDAGICALYPRIWIEDHEAREANPDLTHTPAYTMCQRGIRTRPVRRFDLLKGGKSP
jgi:hypothetical protein